MKLAKRVRVVIAAVMGLACASGLGRAQEKRETHLDDFLRDSGKLGNAILVKTLIETPKANSVVSPIPLSIVLASLLGGDHDAVAELLAALEWKSQNPREAVRTFLGRFEAPPKHNTSKRPTVWGAGPAWMTEGQTETLWMTTTLESPILGFRKHFLDTARRDFGIEFKLVPRGASGGGPLELMEFRFKNRLSIRSRWQFNTGPGYGKFFVDPDHAVDVKLVSTVESSFEHVRTANYEAAWLPGNTASLFVVLPNEGRGLVDVAREIMADPKALDAKLPFEFGKVALPELAFGRNQELRGLLERMGVRKLFSNTRALAPLVAVPGGAALTGIEQNSRITINTWGVLADAETTVSGVYGGVSSDPKEPFHMVVNRPFLFYLRDNVTGAILFLGAVTNPIEK